MFVRILTDSFTGWWYATRKTFWPDHKERVFLETLSAFYDRVSRNKNQRHNLTSKVSQLWLEEGMYTQHPHDIMTLQWLTFFLSFSKGLLCSASLMYHNALTIVHLQSSISRCNNFKHVDKRVVSVCSQFTTLMHKNDDDKTVSCWILYEHHTKVVVSWIMENTGGGVNK